MHELSQPNSIEDSEPEPEQSTKDPSDESPRLHLVSPLELQENDYQTNPELAAQKETVSEVVKKVKDLLTNAEDTEDRYLYRRRRLEVTSQFDYKISLTEYQKPNNVGDTTHAMRFYDKELASYPYGIAVQYPAVYSVSDPDILREKDYVIEKTCHEEEQNVYTLLELTQDPRSGKAKTIGVQETEAVELLILLQTSAITEMH